MGGEVERGFRARGSVGEEERSHHKPGRRVRERARELEKQAPGGDERGLSGGGGKETTAKRRKRGRGEKGPGNTYFGEVAVPNRT